MHAWKGYKRYAWGHDELMPLSRKGKDWLKGTQSGFGTTILDALTTLHVMGFHDEFNEAIDWCAPPCSPAPDRREKFDGGREQAFEGGSGDHRTTPSYTLDLQFPLLIYAPPPPAPSPSSQMGLHPWGMHCADGAAPPLAKQVRTTATRANSKKYTNQG